VYYASDSVDPAPERPQREKAGVPPDTIPDRESVVVPVGAVDPTDAKAKPVNDA